MKHHLPRLLVFSIVCAFYSPFSSAQVGIGTDAPNPKAVLELTSPLNNQGFLVPRLTTTERNAMGLASGDKGMLVFDSSDNKFYYWNGVAWIVIEDSVGTGTVTSVATGAGLTGGPISVSGTISLADNGVTTIKLANGAVTTGKLADASVSAAKLANTAVTAGTYGSATQVPQLVVDPQGRITGVTLTTITGTLPGGAAGGDLTGTYPNPAIAANAIGSAEITDGTVASADIADGTIAAADLANGSVTAPKLANTAVTPGTYGSATQVAQVTVDAQGRITNAVNTTITGAAPTGAAGGDLSGTYPNPAIAANAIGSTEITDGTIATADLANASITTAKIADDAVTDAKIAAVAPSKVTAGGATSGQVLKWNGTNWTPQADNGGSDSQALSFTSPNLTISGGNSVNLSAINTDAQTLTYTAASGLLAISGGNNVTITGTAPGGAAGGNLAGTYPNPTLAATAGTNVVTAVNDASTTGTIGTNRLNAAVVLDSEAPAAGDITGSFSAGLQLAANAVTATEIANAAVGTTELADASVTAAKLAATGVTANTYGSATTVPQITVDAQGRITAASSTTVAGVAPGGTANGDLNGTYPNPTVDGLQGRPVTNTLPTTNQVLKWNGTAWAPGTDATGGGGVGGGGTATQVAYWGSATDITGKSAFVFDEKDNRVGINTASPLGNLHVAGSQVVNHKVLTDDNYTVAATDYSMVFTDLSKPIQVLLPDIAPNNIGRVLIVRSLNSAPLRLVASTGPKDEVDEYGSFYEMGIGNGEYFTLTLIGTQFSGQDRWIIVSGVRSQVK